jgi:peptidoglycan/LPS O-acetylase OafA/YrhL
LVARKTAYRKLNEKFQAVAQGPFAILLAMADRRDHALDGLRGLAALAVLCFHTWNYRDNRPRGVVNGLLNQGFFEGNRGLICFFVLSGFLLYRPFARAALTGERAVELRGYTLRRAARIAPAYYVALIGALLMYALAGYHSSPASVGQWPLFAVFGQNYSLHTVMHLDPPAWTLCIEAAFYVALPVIGWLVWRLGPRRPGRQVAVLVSLIGVTVVWNTIAFNDRWDERATKSLPAWLGEFALGMLVAHWVVARERRTPSRARMRASTTGFLALAGVAVVLACGHWDQTRWLQGDVRRTVALYLAFAAGFALLVAAAAAGRGPVVRALSWRPLALLGLISYGVYLWHLPLILALKQVHALPTPLGPRLAVVFTLACACGALSWRLIERPAIGWAKRRAGRRSARRAPALAPVSAVAAAAAQATR